MNRLEKLEAKEAKEAAAAALSASRRDAELNERGVAEDVVRKFQSHSKRQAELRERETVREMRERETEAAEAEAEAKAHAKRQAEVREREAAAAAEAAEAEGRWHTARKEAAQAEQRAAVEEVRKGFPSQTRRAPPYPYLAVTHRGCWKGSPSQTRQRHPTPLSCSHAERLRNSRRGSPSPPLLSRYSNGLTRRYVTSPIAAYSPR